MTSTHPLPSGPFAANHRDVAHAPANVWRRPVQARSTAFDQPSSPALADTTFRDAAWRLGDRRDLYALATAAFAFASMAVAAALLVH